MTAPQHDLDAERAVMGAMLVSVNAAAMIYDKLEASDFYSETHRVIFRACQELHAAGTPVDRLTVADALSRTDEFERVGGNEYFLSLVESMPTAANATRYAGIVKSRSVLRRLQAAGESIARDALEGLLTDEEALERAEEAVYGLTREAPNGGFSDIQALAHTVLESIQELHDGTAQVMGLETGFKDVDSLFGGLRPGDLDVLAARPAMGKTALALHIMLNVALGGNMCVMFSLEMSKEQLVERLIAMLSQVPLSSIRSGDVPHDGWSDLVQATSTCANLPVRIDDSAGISVSQMRSRLRRLVSREGKPNLVVVDYLQLVKGGRDAKGRSRNDEVAEISRQLKVLAREFDVPVLVLSQLSRAVEARQDKRPVLSDLRDSGAIEQDADRVSFLYRDEYYEPDSDYRGEADLILAKHRNGPTGKVSLAWKETTASFASLAWEREEL